MRGGEHVGRIGVVRSRDPSRDRCGAVAGRDGRNGVAATDLFRVNDGEATERQGPKSHQEECERGAHLLGTRWLAIYDDERGLVRFST